MNIRLIALCAFAAMCFDLSAEEKLPQEFITKCMSEMAVKPGKGHVAVVDCNSGFDVGKIKRFFFTSGYCMNIPYQYYHEGSFDVGKAASAISSYRAKAVIFIVKDDTLPMSLCAAEARWALINYATLSADGAPQQIVNNRMDKMFSRVTMQLLGAGSFMMFENSATKPVANVKDLDALRGRSPAPEAMMNISAYMDAMGFIQPIEAPYYVACQQGWAQAPTNEVQKYIWDQVHAIPDKPLKIQYDTGTQKGKVTK